METLVTIQNQVMLQILQKFLFRNDLEISPTLDHFNGLFLF